MLDFFLGVGSSLDWISPIYYFIRDIVSPSGKIADFGIDAYSGWNKFNLIDLFRHYNIPVWGMTYDLMGDTLSFTVDCLDAEYVYCLLNEFGIPMVYVPNGIFEYE